MTKQMKGAFSKKLSAIRASITTERVGRIYSVAVVGGYAFLALNDAATAQSLRAAGESVFNTIYQVVGVAGGIAGVTTAINWKMGNFLGSRDPKQAFVNSLIGTGAAFGIVGIVQWVKGFTAGSGSISGV
ncbi:hypothetical protein WT12_08425 [Burkholderia territorii]|uniref:hypothetical protein n=1 Tax=Burkholderia territorii TaxID=1503055 RepID=UPI000758410B|nr:hypothetical protein [Burkholderia territorii]KVN48761.1 hypothetical protein WT12_08425 [Burkholderia territorii]